MKKLKNQNQNRKKWKQKFLQYTKENQLLLLLPILIPLSFHFHILTNKYLMDPSFLLFCLLDLAFLLTLLIDSLISYKDYSILLILIAGACFTYYPLWVFAKDFSSPSVFKDRYWYAKHSAYGYLYCISRFFLLFVYVIIAIDDTANLDIPFILKHFPDHTKAISIILLVLFVLLLLLNFVKIVPIFNHRYDQMLEQVTIYETRYMSDGALVQMQHNTMKAAEFSSAAQVLLIPGNSLHRDPRIPIMITNAAVGQ